MERGKEKGRGKREGSGREGWKWEEEGERRKGVGRGWDREFCPPIFRVLPLPMPVGSKKDGQMDGHDRTDCNTVPANNTRECVSQSDWRAPTRRVWSTWWNHVTPCLTSRSEMTSTSTVVTSSWLTASMTPAPPTGGFFTARYMPWPSVIVIFF